MRAGNRMLLDFEYSPERVRSVKAIAGARYHPEDKSWSVPLEAWSSLILLKEFPAHSTLNGLASELVEPVDPQVAAQELREAPFNVRDEVIASLAIELVVRFNSDKRRIRVVPRFGSSAHKVVKRFSGALFSGFDNAYVIPVEKIPELLKKLRDKQIVFAIDTHASAAMSGSAVLRRNIVEAPDRYSADEFASALLTPFITEVQAEQGVAFRPCFFTSEQFKLAFPGVKRQAGKVFVLDERSLLSFVARSSSLPFQVWLTEAVHAFVERKRSQIAAEVSQCKGAIDDVAADVVTVPLLWRTASSGRGALVVNLDKRSELRELLVARLSEVIGATYSNETPSVVMEIPDSLLMNAIGEVNHLCEVHGIARIPRSRSFDDLERDVRVRVKQRERASYYGSLEDLPSNALEGLTLEQASRLFPHQRVAIQWLQEMPYAFLGDDMGLGKTLSVLSYYTALRLTQGFSLLLVVCPNSLSRNWLREASVWFPDLKATVLAGDKGSKAWTLRLLTSGAVEHDIVIVNYEAVRLDYVTPELDKLVTSRKVLLCLDESQRVKNHTAKTFKAINQIAPGCNRRVLLSGTPTPKDVTDLWAQMRILDGGERLGRSFYKWLSRVAELGTEYSQFAVKKFHEEEVSESILRTHEIMLRRRKDKVINLPAKTFTVREVELSGSQADRYNEIREGLILRMRSLSGEQFVREITNILEEYLRAVQVSSNPRLIDPEWKGEPAKFLELDEIVAEVVREQGQKLVVWTNYLGNVRELCERYKDLGSAPFSGEVSAADREKTVRAFQESEKPTILVAVPAAGGVGITLTAAQTAVYVDKTWNAEHWMQSVDRIHRIGQRGTVSIISLLGCKVDEIIHWNLRRKEQRQAQVLGDYKSDEVSEGRSITREELLEALEDG